MKYLICLLFILAHSNLEAQINFNSDDLTFQLTNSVSNTVTTGNQKSEHVAFLLSFGITTISYYSTRLTDIPKNDFQYVMILMGVFLGPNTGSLYAGDFRPLLYGMAFRSVGFAAIFGALYAYFNDIGISNTVGGIAFISGTVLWGGSTIYDIVVSSPRSVKRYNERNSNLSLKPWLNPFNGGAGIRLGLAF